jgi:hypothetical protein
VNVWTLFNLALLAGALWLYCDCKKILRDAKEIGDYAEHCLDAADRKLAAAEALHGGEDELG